MASEFSNATTMSVSYFGEEKDLGEALDDCFKQLQSNLNNTHCRVRELAMCPEQDGDFYIMCEMVENIEDYVTDMTGLMKELIRVVKQVRGNGSNAAEKNELKARAEKRKLQKQQQKLEGKQTA
jgi:hypothetical protein